MLSYKYLYLFHRHFKSLLSLPNFFFVKVFVQPYFTLFVLAVFIETFFFGGALFSNKEGARKEPLYLSAAFGAPLERFLVYALPDFKFVLT